MTITIYEGYDNSYIMLGCKDERFEREWGRILKIPASSVYKDLAQVAKWVNNELGEECLFEVD